MVIDTGCNSGSCGVCEVNSPDDCCERHDPWLLESCQGILFTLRLCIDSSQSMTQVEVRKFGGANAEADGAPAVVRACITAVPPGYSSIEIALLGDQIWGSDGWDT